MDRDAIQWSKYKWVIEQKGKLRGHKAVEGGNRKRNDKVEEHANGGRSSSFFES